MLLYWIPKRMYLIVILLETSSLVSALTDTDQQLQKLLKQNMYDWDNRSDKQVGT